MHMTLFRNLRLRRGTTNSLRSLLLYENSESRGELSKNSHQFHANPCISTAKPHNQAMTLRPQFSLKLVSPALILLLCLLLGACTPALNWRDVRLESTDGSALKAALPCKPDSATRKQQLGDIQVDLSMMGCMASETTFTLSRVPLTNPLDSPKVMAAWQAAGVANIKAKPTPTVAATVLGAGAWPPAARVTLLSETIQAHMLWFAKQTATGVVLYQAALYGKQPSNEALTTFFESLEVQ